MELSRRNWLAAIFWALFGAGILVQGFAPRLRVENNAFVVPESMAELFLHWSVQTCPKRNEGGCPQK